MWIKKNSAKSGALCCISLASFALSSAACTKKSSDSSPAPAANPQLTATPSTAQPGAGLPNGGTEKLFRYALSSAAGDVVFCQDFTSQSQPPIADVESVTDSLGIAQAQIPAGVINPFSPKALGLSVRPAGCSLIPEVIRNGHCAISLSRDVTSGKLTLQTEQRLLWKDLPILAQASYIKATLDNKNNTIKSKNELFASVQKQITQQQQFLTILQLGQQLTTGDKVQLIEQAQEVLSNLQKQSQNLENEVKGLETELVPIQAELSKTLEKLETSRTALKQACTPAGMGATSAEWKAN